MVDRAALRKATTSSFEGRCVGRIYKAISHAPREAPWFWGLEFHEWQGSDGPQYGQVATLETAKQAFRAAWDRRPCERKKLGYLSNSTLGFYSDHYKERPDIKQRLVQPA